ncbi:MAG TPA: ribosome small subunit-dependent GTPase A [Gemmatimonadaceae bacterium]|nr:ribosome small subunit-dependent GTPase A [Gemmatimonadaceae bacterium]
MSDTARGVVLSGTGGVWKVHLDDRRAVDASLRGRLKKSRDQPGEEPTGLKLAVGDFVRVEQSDHGDWAITEILPRRSKLARRAPGGAHGERVLAANVDQVIVMFAAVKPEPHPRMLDRFLVIAEANELPSRIVINKIELADLSAVKAMFSPYELAGYPVHYVSVKSRLGLEPLHDAFAGHISVLTGPSGVGKSSLLNATFPGANLRVGEISESVQKGRHTTVGAVMLELPGAEGGFIVDTPGLREVGLWSIPSDRLDSCFPEFRPHLEKCRFGDCIHVHEPDCGVREAVARGEISAARYESYMLLLEDVRAAG